MAMHRKRPLPDPQQYYAYVWRYKNQVVWVGHGKNNRGRPGCRASWGGRPEALVRLLDQHWREVAIEIIPCMSKAEAVNRERELIARLRPTFNTATQHGGWPGMHTEAGLARISASQRERVYTEEECKARSERLVGNQNLLGFAHTDETKKKLSEANKGRRPGELCRAKSSARMKEHNRTNPPRKGKPCSSEHRRKLSEAAKRRAR